MNTVSVYLKAPLPNSVIDSLVFGDESVHRDDERLHWFVGSASLASLDQAQIEFLDAHVGLRPQEVVLEYSGGLQRVKAAVRRLVADRTSVVDDDHDELMSGERLSERLADEEWDWRK